MKKHLARIVVKINDKSSHDELLKSAKTWPLHHRFDRFDLLKEHLSTSEIADLLFSDYDRVDDCDFCNIQDSENLDEITKIAIKENHVCDFIFFVYYDFSYAVYDGLIPYIRSLVDMGASEKDLLELLLLEIDICRFTEKVVEELTEYGFDLNLIIDEIIYSILEIGFYNNVYLEPKGLAKVIESLNEENQKKLYAKIKPKDFEKAFFDEDCFLARKWLSRFCLKNAPKIEGDMPLLYMEVMPEEFLVSHERATEFKEYLKRVVCSQADEESTESANRLLALFE